MENYRKGLIFNNTSTMLPWFSHLIDEDRRLLGDDWWPYGMEANRKAVDAFLRYHFEQGLSNASADMRGHFRAGVAHNITPRLSGRRVFAPGGMFSPPRRR